MTFKSNDIHPAVRDSLRRLAALERRTPPGYPLGYSLHMQTWLCQGCGRTSENQLLWTIHRSGAKAKSYHVTHPNETIYDLPVDVVQRHQVTARCEWCITILKREPIPALPAANAKLKPEIDVMALFDDIEAAGQGLTEGPGIGEGTEAQRAEHPNLVNPKHAKMLKDGPVRPDRQKSEIDLKALGLL